MSKSDDLKWIRVHVLHLITADEIELFDKGLVNEKKITVKACIHHLWQFACHDIRK